MRKPFPKTLQNYLSKLTSPIKPKITSVKEKEDDGDEILFENFISLYREEYEEGSSLPLLQNNLSGSGQICDQSGSQIKTDDMVSASPTSTSEGGDLAPEDLIMLLIDSPDPYDVLRQSILEMVEARIELNRSVDWKFLEELMFCYFDMNDKESHRRILQAFVDVIVFLKQNSAILRLVCLR
ncbi:hypothetical protein SASPL_118863 [Salvia splendens]|uniref:Transcription repressor n=1 Tax=Salvia splendens TaxID=180675 RepID=A0A8X8ZXM3_SALSN|nr:transcription repressor OFP14-like [Salvia splendens]KAG6422297.1 hypothetical protein SASPL_118863 [Salvia splendens]